MTFEFKETFSKSPSQNDSSTHDSLKLMPNLNAMPKRLPVHLFSFSLLVSSRITLKFKLQKSFLCRNIFNTGLKSEHVNILDAIYESDTWLDLLVYFVHMHRHNHVFVFKLICPLFEIKGLVNCSRDKRVKLIRASKHICLHNSRDRGDTLENGGRWCGVCFVRLFPVSNRIMFYFSHYLSDLTQNYLPYFVPYW